QPGRLPHVGVGWRPPKDLPDWLKPQPVRYIELKTFRFWSFQHPYVCEFVKALNRGGVDSLLNPAQQVLESDYFQSTYKPTALVDHRYPKDEVDFEIGGPYADYNWELFFHAPFLVADRLRPNQRFEDAQSWFHYIFDPPSG